MPNKENYGSTNAYRGQLSGGVEEAVQKGLGSQEVGQRKPLISPVRNPFKGGLESVHGEQKKINKIDARQSQAELYQQLHDQRFCVKHPNKEAEFNIEVEDECLTYCGRCAAQLASQGFEVTKI
jgi:hypothetical protein